MVSLIQVHIKVLEKHEDEILPGLGYVVKFYDRDVLKDDLLAETVLDHTGKVRVRIKAEKLNPPGISHEKFPDIYFTIFKNDKMINKSEVYKNMHWKLLKNESRETGMVFDPGTVVL